MGGQISSPDKFQISYKPTRDGLSDGWKNAVRRVQS